MCIIITQLAVLCYRQSPAKYCADNKRPDELSGKDITDEEYAAWSVFVGRELQCYLDGAVIGDTPIAAITKA